MGGVISAVRGDPDISARLHTKAAVRPIDDKFSRRSQRSDVPETDIVSLVHTERERHLKLPRVSHASLVSRARWNSRKAPLPGLWAKMAGCSALDSRP